MPVSLKRRLLTVDEYHQMGEVGILKESGLELINGEIIEMSPVGSNHAAIVEKTKDLLVIRLIGKAIVRVQNPIIANDFSEPEPDIAIVKFRSDYYSEQHPQPDDIFLIIEVADSAVEIDREIKLPVYASAGIPEYWIADIKQRRVEVYHTPVNESYKYKKIAQANDLLTAQAIDFSFSVSAIFG